MALENDDLIVVQKSGGGELRKAKISDIKPDVAELWTEDSGKLYPTTLTNNVGIGTDNPSQKLHIYDDTQATIRVAKSGGANVYLSQNDDDSASFYNDGQGPLRIKTFQSQPVIFYTDNSDKMRIMPNGNVGIGTDSPSQKLEVVSDAGTIVRVTSGDSDGSFLDLGKASSPTGGRIGYDPGNNLLFCTETTEKMRIKSNGNVGIGDNNPGRSLTVKNSGQYDGLLIKDTANSSVAELIGFEADGSSGGLALWNSGDKNVNILADGNSYFNGGNIGIGTDSPSGKLDVQNGENRAIKFEADSVSGDNHIKSYQGTSENVRNLRITGQDISIDTNSSSESEGINRVVIKTNGDVGIGTDAPQTLLNLQPTDNVSAFQISQNNANDGYRFHVDGPSGGHLYLKRWASNAEDTKVTLLANGNVGIGTDSPNTLLTVKGSGNATTDNVSPGEYTASFLTDTALLSIGSVDGKPCLQSSGGGTGYNLQLNPFKGNVGIGVTGTPAEKLHVDGNGRFGGNPDAGAAAGIQANSAGLLLACRAAGSNIFAGFKQGTSTATSLITSDGKITVKDYDLEALDPLP